MKAGISTALASLMREQLIPVRKKIHKPLFLIGHFAWHFATGFQLIFYSWILTGPLNIPAGQFGLYQAAAQIPVLIFLLPAGLIFDRIPLRRAALTITFVYGALAYYFAFIFYDGGLEPSWILTFILAAYTAAAFILPAREKALGEITTGDVIRNASHMSTTEYAGRLAGMLAAGFVVDTTITQAFLLIAIGVTVSGASFLLSRSRQSNRFTKKENSDGAMSLGFRRILQDSSVIKALSFQAIGGCLGVGGFIVFVPLTVRQNFGADPIVLSIFTTVAWSGTIVASSLVGRFVTKMQQVTTAQCLSNLCLAAAIFLLVSVDDWVVTLIAAAFWGASAGLSLTSNRIVIQTRANPEEIARAGSLLHFAHLAFIPLGAASLGAAIELAGLQTAGAWIAVILIGYTFLFLMFTLFYFSGSQSRTTLTRNL